MENLHETFDHLNKALNTLSSKDRMALERCIIDLSELASQAVENNKWHQHEKVEFSLIAKYLSKKLGEARQRDIQPSISLRQLRNELAHGRSLKFYDPVQIKKLESLLWKVLEKSTIYWDPFELSNLLSYCLNIKSINIGRITLEQGKIVRIYKNIYANINETEKEYVFRELILRLFSEPKFLFTLEEMEIK